VDLTVTSDTDPSADVITVKLRGVLSLLSASSVRIALLKAFARYPEAVIIDLTHLEVKNRCLLTVFPAAMCTHGNPPVALLLYGAGAHLSALMTGGVLGDVPVFATRALALTALAKAPPVTTRRLQASLAPTSRSVAVARHLIAEVCRSWHLDHLTGPATLITSELVSNAIQHAGTDLRLTGAHRGDFLHLGVRDGSRHLPRMTRADISGQGPLAERGRGLFLVDVYATAWGSDPCGGGKVVWATLRSTPLGRRQP
jgi:anti-sigma regulatory factor (Ser/Thr protein kinase)